MSKIFSEFQAVPADSADKVLDAARSVLERQGPCDNLSHAETSQRTGSLPADTEDPAPGVQLPLPADWAAEPDQKHRPKPRHNPSWQIADNGTLSLEPPYLLIRYPSGRLVIRTHADTRTLTRASVQAVKPSSVLLHGTRVLAVTYDKVTGSAAIVEKEKAAK